MWFAGWIQIRIDFDPLDHKRSCFVCMWMGLTKETLYVHIYKLALALILQLDDLSSSSRYKLKVLLKVLSVSANLVLNI